MTTGLAWVVLVGAHLIYVHIYGTVSQPDATSRLLNTLPIGTGTWEETFGAWLGVCQVSYSTLDAWSGTVRASLPQ